MRRLIAILSLPLVLVACSDATAPEATAPPAAQQAAAETAESVITKHLAAQGGEARLRAAKTMKFTAKGESGDVQMLTVYRQRPNQFRKEFTKEGGQTFVKAFDGSAGWSLEGTDKLTVMPQEKTAMMAQHADFDDGIIDYQAKGHKVELVGKEDVRGAPAFKLKMTMKSGDVEYRYIDATSHLEVKRTSTWQKDGKTEESTTYFSDYRTVDGIKVNHVIETESGDKKSKLVIQEVWFDRPIDGALFRKPEA
jgi:outer membrane lipoprotein-sorting protein